MKRVAPLLLLALLTSALSPRLGRAADANPVDSTNPLSQSEQARRKSYHQEEAQIPHEISAPPSMIQKGPAQIAFHCDRRVLYQGRELTCDSYNREDGENLRPILSHDPDAIAELNEYQRNKLAVRNVAYVETLGILVAVGGLIASRYLGASVDPTFAAAFRSITVFGGLGLTVGGFVYGFSNLRDNEQHLFNAVQDYNRAHPENTIQVQFSTGFNLY